MTDTELLNALAALVRRDEVRFSPLPIGHGPPAFCAVLSKKVYAYYDFRQLLRAVIKDTQEEE